MKNIDEIYFCPHTLDFFSNFTEHDKTIFFFVYSFKSIYSRVNRTVLSYCFECQNLIVNKHNPSVSCFQIEKKLPCKNVSLKGKIVVGYCGGHNTIIFFFFFEGYQEKFIRLCGENITY